MCKITLVGAGKLAEHLIKGILKAGVSADSIVVYGRTEESFSRVTPLGVTTTTDLAPHLDGRLLILCVQPKHVGQLAHDLTAAKEAARVQKGFYPRLQVLSLISGQSINQISENFKIDPGRIVVATMDTSVAICRTIIPYMVHGNNSALTSDALQLINNLGTPRQVDKYQKVLRGVTEYGAGKALDLTVLKLLYQESSVASVREFIDSLDYYLTEHNVAATGFLGWHIDSWGKSANDLLKKYLLKKTEAIESVFGKSRTRFFDSYATFAGTVAMLKAEPDLSEETFALQIQNIATKDGCTERGLGLVKTTRHFSANDFRRQDRKAIGENEDIKENRLHAFFSKVHHRSARFKDDARKSFDFVVDTTVAKQVFGSFASGNYPLK